MAQPQAAASHVTATASVGLNESFSPANRNIKIRLLGNQLLQSVPEAQTTSSGKDIFSLQTEVDQVEQQLAQWTQVIDGLKAFETRQADLEGKMNAAFGYEKPAYLEALDNLRLELSGFLSEQSRSFSLFGSDLADITVQGTQAKTLHSSVVNKRIKFCNKRIKELAELDCLLKNILNEEYKLGLVNELAWKLVYDSSQFKDQSGLPTLCFFPIEDQSTSYRIDICRHYADPLFGKEKLLKLCAGRRMTTYSSTKNLFFNNSLTNNLLASLEGVIEENLKMFEDPEGNILCANHYVGIIELKRAIGFLPAEQRAAISNLHSRLPKGDGSPLSLYLLCSVQATFRREADVTNKPRGLDPLLCLKVDMPDGSYKVFAIGEAFELEGHKASADEHLARDEFSTSLKE